MSKKKDKEIREAIRQCPSNKVKVAITDVDGVMRGKYLNKEKFFAALDSGFGFCNVIFGWDASDVCYEGASYTGWHSGYPDALASVDLATFRRVPWDGNVPFFLADFEDGRGNPLHVCPRRLLRGVLADLASAGFVAKVGLEYEWFNFHETPKSLDSKLYVSPTPMSPGMFGYSLLRMSQNLPFFNALMDELAAFGVPIEGLHTETGPGVMEAAVLYADALEAADRGVLFKAGAKEIAHRYGIMPSFMAKWDAKLPGCSGHMHISLWEDDSNVFYDPDDPHRMSQVQKSFIAGLLRALPEVTPMFAPNVNSYKRLVDGYWAPTKPTWGIDNRTVAVRVIPGSAKSTRIELRVPGSDSNPYLAVAAALAAGLRGIRDERELSIPPTVGSAYTHSEVPRLPTNLQIATDRMAESSFARELLGAAFVDHFVMTRRWEWKKYEEAVTNWEIARYFEII